MPCRLCWGEEGSCLIHFEFSHFAWALASLVAQKFKARIARDRLYIYTQTPHQDAQKVCNTIKHATNSQCVSTRTCLVCAHTVECVQTVEKPHAKSTKQIQEATKKYCPRTTCAGHKSTQLWCTNSALAPGAWTSRRCGTMRTT